MTATTISLELPVWQILYDKGVHTPSDWLIIELRDKQQVEWVAIDASQLQIRWRYKLDDWWWSATIFENGRLYLHQYAQSDQFVPKNQLIIDSRNGEIYQENKSRGLEVGETSNYFKWQSSVSYEPSNPYYTKISDFIAKYVTEIPHNSINYGDFFGNLIFSYYFYPPNTVTLSRSILVVHKSKQLLLHYVIALGVSDICSAEYLYDKDCLIYLQKPNELVVLNWSKS